MAEEIKKLEDLLQSGFITTDDFNTRYEDVLVQNGLEITGKVFSRFSSGGSYLDESGFSKLLVFLGEKLSEKEKKEVFLLVDEDRDKKISLKDLILEQRSETYEGELLRFIQVKLKSRAYLSNKLSPPDSNTTDYEPVPTSESQEDTHWNVDLTLEVGSLADKSRSFHLVKEENPTLASEIRSQAGVNSNACVFTLNFVSNNPSISEETLDIFLHTLQTFYDEIGLNFQKPHFYNHNGKHYLKFPAQINPEEHFKHFIQLLDPQILDFRIDLDTESPTLQVILALKAKISTEILNVPIFRVRDEEKTIFKIGKSLLFNARVSSVSELLAMDHVQKNFFQGTSEEWKALVASFSSNTPPTELLDQILEKYYKDMKGSGSKLDAEMYQFFRAYPRVIKELDTLESITLVVDNLVFSLNIDFPGLFKKLPIPTDEDEELFHGLPVKEKVVHTDV
jgi:hypothetical protein